MVIDIGPVLQECVHPAYQARIERIATVESAKNPLAIGVVDGKLVRQPTSVAEAVATAKALDAAGWNFSLGLAQINKFNLARLNLDFLSVFDPCNNLRASSAILAECDLRARKQFSGKEALDAAHSCYYAGNFKRGQQPDFVGGTSYVQRVSNAAATFSDSEAVAPPIEVVKTTAKAFKPAQAVEKNLPAESSAEPGGDAKPLPAPSTPTWDVLGEFSSQQQKR